MRLRQFPIVKSMLIKYQVKITQFSLLNLFKMLKKIRDCIKINPNNFILQVKNLFLVFKSTNIANNDIFFLKLNLTFV